MLSVIELGGLAPLTTAGRFAYESLLYLLNLYLVDTHGLTPVALAKEVCIYLEGCMPSNSL